MKNAHRVNISALMQCCIDLKPTRKESEVYIDRQIDVTPLVDYIEEKKKNGIHYTYFHAFLTAIGKVIYNRAKLNYFVTNRHLYEHDDITISFVAKMSLDDKSEELMLVVPIEKDDTIATIADKAAGKVAKLRGQKADKSGANNAVDSLAKLPNIIRVPVFAVLKTLGKFGWLPTSLTDNNIYFTSMIISNLGSIRCGAIYHNLADFGTCSSLATIGEIKSVKSLMSDGSEQIRKVCNFGVTLDERIADGFYFAKSLAIIEHILQHPEMLEEPASQKIEL